MMQVFVDTSAWIALINARDQLHRQAHNVNARLTQQRVRWVTTEFVLIEVADALSSPPLRQLAIDYLNNLRRRPHFSIVPVSEELLQWAWDFYSRRLDKDWSLTDCTSFVVMTQEGMTQAFTADHHFEQAGFKKLL